MRAYTHLHDPVSGENTYGGKNTCVLLPTSTVPRLCLTDINFQIHFYDFSIVRNRRETWFYAERTNFLGVSSNMELFGEYS